jgi:protein TorT
MLLTVAWLGAAVPQPAALASEQDALAWPAPYDYSGQPTPVRFTPLGKAQRSWRLCAAYPHLKDAYWISVNYGMVDQARAAGVSLSVSDAGGYPNTQRQREQIEACSGDADALIVGAVSYSGLNETVRKVAGRMPVVAAINDMQDVGLAAKVGVPWSEMGRLIGAYLARRHPTGTAEKRIAWFPGPDTTGWARFVDSGFRRGLAGSAAVIALVKQGDTGFNIQTRLVEEALDESQSIDYVVGSAVTADAAVSVLREKARSETVGILADYFTHGTYREIRRHKTIAAPTDSPVLQGRMAVDQAIRALEKKLEHKHIGPAIVLVDKDNIDSIDLGASLSPGSFEPRFTVP